MIARSETKNDLVDQWLADPKGCCIEQEDILPALEALETRLTDAWEHGREAELGCIHIDFQKIEAGWVLDEIWVCR